MRKLISRGTLSVLVGVHNFLWHPFTVWRAWRYLYKRNPTWIEGVCIFCHDIAYWGKPDMDGVEGRTHPEGGAKVAQWIVLHWMRLFSLRPDHEICHLAELAHNICLGHSTHYAQARGLPVSALYLPDKVCILFDPPWFYKLRAWLSGELAEYVDRENHARWIFGQDILTTDQWLTHYRAKTQKKADEFLRAEAKRKQSSFAELWNRVDREFRDQLTRGN